MTTKIDSGIAGSALAASDAYKKGDVVLTFTAEGSSVQTRTSVQVAPGVHVEDELGANINHLCDPNCELRGRDIVAIKDINPGDEITIDYRITESPLASPFSCSCCGEMIQ